MAGVQNAKVHCHGRWQSMRNLPMLQGNAVDLSGVGAGGPSTQGEKIKSGCNDRQLHCPACRRRGEITGAPSTAEAMYVFPPLQAIPLLQSSQGTPDLSSSYWRSLFFAPWLQIGCEEAFSFLGKRGYRSNTAVRKQDLASVAEREDAQSDERTAMLRQPRCPSFAPERMVCRYGSCATPTTWVMAELSPFW